MAESSLSEALAQSIPGAIAGGIIGYADVRNKTNNLPVFLQQMAARQERLSIKAEKKAEERKQAKKTYDALRSDENVAEVMDRLEAGGAPLADLSPGELRATVAQAVSLENASKNKAEQEAGYAATVAALAKGDPTMRGNLEQFLDENPEASSFEQVQYLQGVQQEEMSRMAREDRERNLFKNARKTAMDTLAGSQSLVEYNDRIQALLQANPDLAGDELFLQTSTNEKKRVQLLDFQRGIASDDPEQFRRGVGVRGSTEEYRLAWQAMLDPYRERFATLSSNQLGPEFSDLQEWASKYKSLDEAAAQDPEGFIRFRSTGEGALALSVKRAETQREEQRVNAAVDANVDALASVGLAGRGFLRNPVFDGARLEDLVDETGRIKKDAVPKFVTAVVDHLSKTGADPDVILNENALAILQDRLPSETAPMEIYRQLRKRQPLGVTPILAEEAKTDHAAIALDLGLEETLGQVETETTTERVPYVVRSMFSPYREYEPKYRRDVASQLETYSKNLDYYERLAAQEEERNAIARALNPTLVQGITISRFIKQLRFYQHLRAIGGVQEWVDTGKVPKRVAAAVTQDQVWNAVTTALTNVTEALQRKPITVARIHAAKQEVAELSAEVERMRTLDPTRAKQQEVRLAFKQEDVAKLQSQYKLRLAHRATLRELVAGGVLNKDPEDIATFLAETRIQGIADMDTFAAVAEKAFEKEDGEGFGDRLRKLQEFYATQAKQLFSQTDAQAAEQSRNMEIFIEEVDRAISVYDTIRAQLNEYDEDMLHTFFPERVVGQWQKKGVDKLAEILLQEGWEQSGR